MPKHEARFHIRIIPSNCRGGRPIQPRERKPIQLQRGCSKCKKYAMRPVVQVLYNVLFSYSLQPQASNKQTINQVSSSSHEMAIRELSDWAMRANHIKLAAPLRRMQVEEKASKIHQELKCQATRGRTSGEARPASPIQCCA